jgi:Flp pilus assembly pilin Flp
MSLSRFHRDESGATMIEYILAAAIISIELIVCTWLAGDGVATMFKYVAGPVPGSF